MSWFSSLPDSFEVSSAVKRCVSSLPALFEVSSAVKRCVTSLPASFEVSSAVKRCVSSLPASFKVSSAVKRCVSSVPLYSFCALGNGQTYTRDPGFVRFEECLVHVDFIDLWDAPMEGNRFVHTFLGIEIRLTDPKDNRTQRDIRYIKAEKFFDNKKKCGAILLEAFGERRQAVEGEKRRHEFELDGCGKMQMSRLLDILEAHNSDYGLFNDNCWKYADKTIRQVVQGFAELPDTSTEKKNSLLKELANLPTLVMPSDGVNYMIGVGISIGALCYIGTKVYQFVKTSATQNEEVEE